MTRLWEENKPLILVLGACALALIIIRPTLFGTGPPLARWLGAAWKGQHDKLESESQALHVKNREFAPGAGRDSIVNVKKDLEKSNESLTKEFDQGVQALVFVPYRPFLPPEDKEQPDWGYYFMTVLTETLDGTSDRRREGLHQYCSPRGAKVTPDLGFGEIKNKGVPPTGKTVPGLLRQLAVAETFVKLCADNQVRSIEKITYLPRRELGTKGRKFLWEYPMKVELRTGFDPFTKLLDALQGQRAGVTQVRVDELDDVVEGVMLNQGSEHGVQVGDRFTIYKRAKDTPCSLQYAARVRVTTLWKGKSYARIEEDSLPYARLDTEARKAAKRVQEGDYAVSGFFRVLRMDVKAVPGKVDPKDTDGNGAPKKVVPYMLTVALDVSTFGFDPTTKYITAKNVDGETGGRVKLKTKKPGVAKKPAVRAGPTW